MQDLIAIILAAGEGKRMKSKKSKLVHKACGKALIEWVYSAVEGAGIKKSIVVIGHRGDQVKQCMGDQIAYETQEQQLGTGHAVMQAQQHLKDLTGNVVVLCADTPLVTSETLLRAIDYHESNQCSATVITAEVENPTGYGRIIRDEKGGILHIVEEKDASIEEKDIKEINSGMYCFKIEALIQVLQELKNDNQQGEYYLTDTLEILAKKGFKVGGVKINDANEILGVNDRIQLAKASEILRHRILRRQMLEGVTIIDPSSTYIEEGVTIGMDSILYPGTILEGKTVIGENCVIGPNTRLVNISTEDNVEIVNSVAYESTLGAGTKVGPFAYIRPHSIIGKNVKIGDFVEIKKSTIGDDTKVSHLTYIGDATVGEKTNIACGVVTVNYDGKNKYKTIIGNHAFVGCNVNLVAPVTINDHAYIAAGSTITEEVPPYALAIARSRQTNKEQWLKTKGKDKIKE